MCLLMDLAQTLQTLLMTEADELARQTGCVRRARKLSGAVLVQTLVLGWLHDPHASLDGLADFAATLGADLSPQALHQRLTAATTQCLAQLLQSALLRVVAATPDAPPLLRRFQGVYVFDSTPISLPAALAGLFPGCGGNPGDGAAALKVHACLELTTGALELDFGPGRQPDVSGVLARGPLPEGALRLADRGFFDLAVLRDYTEQDVYWLTRLPAGVMLQTEQEEPLTLAAFLQGQHGDHLDLAVRVGKEAQLPCRLVARRAPVAVVAKRQEQLRKQARKKGRPVSAAQLALCGWTAYLTNLSGEQLRWEELWVLARCRWQIELLFKLWKSGGGLDEVRGERPERVLCELYAKQLGLLVQQWLLVSSGGPCLSYSHPKAAVRVRRLAPLLALLLGAVEEVARLLLRLRQRIERRCRPQKRGKRPSTRELLLDPDRIREREEPPEEDCLTLAA
jgi:Transposase DDE domain